MALIVVMRPLGYELVATDRSNLVASLMARAVALAEQNQLKLARLHFLRALELDEGSAVAHNGLAIVLARQGDLVGAAKHFAEVDFVSAVRVDVLYHGGVRLED